MEDKIYYRKDDYMRQLTRLVSQFYTFPISTFSKCILHYSSSLKVEMTDEIFVSFRTCLDKIKIREELEDTSNDEYLFNASFEIESQFERIKGEDD